MSKTEVVKKFMTALQSGDMTMAADCITDDFVFRGWAPRSLDKGKFLAIQNELRTALTGYSYNLSNLNERGNGVEAFIQLPCQGVPCLPGTGRNWHSTGTSVRDILYMGLGTLLRERETVRPSVPFQLNGRVPCKNAVQG